jgi:hypothetical protein
VPVSAIGSASSLAGGSMPVKWGVDDARLCGGPLRRR